MKSLNFLRSLANYSTNSLHIKNGTVVTLGDMNQVLENHSVIVEGETITCICPTSEIDSNQTFIKEIDATDHLVMPGLINAHHHFYSSFARGLGKAPPSENFLEVLDNLWWRLDKLLTVEDCYYSSMVAMLQCIRHGCTTVIDHHASPYAITGSLDSIADAVVDCGLRASLCYELSDRDGQERAMEGIEENVKFLERCDEEMANNQLRGLFGLHASFTIEDETLAMASQAGKDHGFHVHTAEGISDQEITVEKFGKRVVERFHDAGILGEKTILAHCIHLEDHEMDMVKDSNSIVVHNPQSNMNNAVGVQDLMKLSEKGILVGLGTDAMTSNMLEELRCAMWVRHLSDDHPNVGFMEVASTLVWNNAEIAKRYWGDIGIGQLREGGVGDLAIMEYHSPTQFDETTFLGHLIFGISQHRVSHTISRGQVLMEDGKLTQLDEKAIMSEAKKLSKIVWDKF